MTLGFSMSREDAIIGSLGLLGFGRATSHVSAVLDKRIDFLIVQGRLLDVAGVITVSEPH